MIRSVEFYQTEQGSYPLRKFLGSLNGKDAQQILWVFRLIERVDRVPSK